MANQFCGLAESGTMEHDSLYYKCLGIGHVWAHTISMSGNGYWSPSQQTESQMETFDYDETAFDELWKGIELTEPDKYDQLKELLCGMEFSSVHTADFSVPVAAPQNQVVLVAQPAEIFVYWAA